MVMHADFPTEVRVAAESRAATAAGFEVDVVALRRPGEEAFEVVDGARVYRLPVRHVHGRGVIGVVREYVGFSMAALLRVARLSRRNRYDIVQVHNPPDFLAIAALGARLRGTRLIWDVHDLAPDMFHMRYEGRRGLGFADWVLRRVERRVGKWADAVLTVHEPYRQELARRGIDAGKITVLLNSVPEDVIPQSEAPARDEFRVVYHGTVTPHYGVVTLVEAAALAAPDVPTLTVDIYGEGDSMEEVERRSRELGLADRVRFHATLPQRDVLEAVAGASVGVVPNLPVRLNQFALSTKLFEYVALEIPVVSSDLPTIRAHFSGDEIRYFEPGDAAALAEALKELARDPDGARSRARAARERYHQYRWSVQAERYEQVLLELVSR